MANSTVYLIPCPLSEDAMHTIPGYVKNRVHQLQYFIAEKAKTTRAFLKEAQHPLPLQQIQVEQMDKHDPQFIMQVFQEWLEEGRDIGVVSEAGCPGIADPGARIVAEAHRKGIKVVPLVGPTSLILALMASGMNGQSFTFHGYLPQNAGQLRNELNSIQKQIVSNGSSHLFIETPYRNQKIFQEIVNQVPGEVMLCIAIDVTGKQESIKTAKVSTWRKTGFPTAEKIPCIFILGK